MNWQDAASHTAKHPFRGGGSLPFKRAMRDIILTQQVSSPGLDAPYRFSITRLCTARPK